MQKWEYHRHVIEAHALIRGYLDEELRRLGAEGWELVTTVSRDKHGTVHEVRLMFKRPLGP
jgi:hypothetical protein